MLGIVLLTILLYVVFNLCAAAGAVLRGVWWMFTTKEGWIFMGILCLISMAMRCGETDKLPSATPQIKSTVQESPKPLPAAVSLPPPVALPVAETETPMHTETTAPTPTALPVAEPVTPVGAPVSNPHFAVLKDNWEIGNPYGSVTLPRGTILRIQRVSPDGVFVVWNGSTIFIKSAGVELRETMEGAR